MNRRSLLRFLAAAAVLIAAATLARAAGSAANPAWEKMKTLVGDWQGTAVEEGKKIPVSVSYRLVSSGTTLMETLKAPGENDMVTMYVPDGDRIVMTHYCSMGNQPRMSATPAKEAVSRLDFQYLDATNLSGPDAMRMQRLVVKFRDADHFTQEWTHRAEGKDSTGVFEYARKKSAVTRGR
jgi:hypothetical protein